MELLEPLLHRVCVEAKELPLHLRSEKLAHQFAINLAANPNNSVYETIFNPRFDDHFSRKPMVISIIWINYLADRLLGSTGQADAGKCHVDEDCEYASFPNYFGQVVISTKRCPSLVKLCFAVGY